MIAMSLPETLIGLHFVAAGAHSTVNRMAAQRNLSEDTLIYLTAVSTVCFTGVTLVALLLWYPSIANWEVFPTRTALVYVILFSVIGGVYFTVSRLRYASQALLPSFVYEPLSRLHVFIVVPVAVLFLEDTLSSREGLAIVLALSAILLIGFATHRRERREGSGHLTQGLLLLLTAGIFAAGLQLLSKVLMTPDLAIQVPVLIYILCSNTATTVISSLRHVGRQHPAPSGQLFAFGIGAGLCNFIALGSLLFFLIDGKASRIYSVSAMSMLIPIAFGFLTRRERNPGKLEILALVCALGAIVLQTTGGGE